MCVVDWMKHFATADKQLKVFRAADVGLGLSFSWFRTEL